jgi:hypothetical protein
VQLTGRAHPRRHRQVAVRYGRGRQSTPPTATALFGIPTASSVAWHY